MVLLVIHMENESSKYYINLNRDDYTCYPDENEVLLQAGLTAEVKEVKNVEFKDQTLTEFHLYICE